MDLLPFALGNGSIGEFDHRSNSKRRHRLSLDIGMVFLKAKIHRYSRSHDWPKGGYMFEQISNPDGADKKTWKERLSKGARTLAVITLILGGFLLYALSIH
jgi:hypothetical protein